jgi:hypothetical protein
MEPTREPRPTKAALSDEAVVAYLRARAPGLPPAQFDPRAVTSRARRALRRRRLRHAAAAVTGAAAAYLALALAGPLAVPGLGSVTVPGGDALRPIVAGPDPERTHPLDRRQADVDRLEAQVLPVVQDLALSYYLLEEGPCRVLEYPRGNYRDGSPECGDLVPFDAQARADFDAVTAAVERSGVAVERIFRQGGIYVQLEDNSWQYNWEYVYRAGIPAPPATTFPGEEWTHIRGDWWYHRAHDD